MITFEYPGDALTHQKFVPGDTVASLSAYCYKYQLYRLNFTAAAAAIVVGNWVVEEGTSTVGRVRYVTSTNWTGTGVGYVLIDSWNGVAWTNDVNLHVIAADKVVIDQAAAIVEASDAEYALAGMQTYKHMMAKAALVVCYANTALVSITGGDPDQTNLVGTPMVANSSIMLKDHNAITNFHAINYTSQTATILQVDFFF